MTSTLSTDDLRHFTGEDIRYRHPLNPNVIYTAGVRHVAQAGQAYWLLDEVALALGSRALARWIADDPRVADMQFWRLTVNADAAAELTAVADADVPPFFKKRIRWTDFPLPKVDIWCAYDGIRWTMYLPSEH